MHARSHIRTVAAGEDGQRASTQERVDNERKDSCPLRGASQCGSRDMLTLARVVRTRTQSPAQNPISLSSHPLYAQSTLSEHERRGHMALSLVRWVLNPLTLVKCGNVLLPLRFVYGVCPIHNDLSPNTAAANDDCSASVDFEPGGAAHQTTGEVAAPPASSMNCQSRRSRRQSGKGPGAVTTAALLHWLPSCL